MKQNEVFFHHGQGKLYFHEGEGQKYLYQRKNRAKKAQKICPLKTNSAPLGQTRGGWVGAERLIIRKERLVLASAPYAPQKSRVRNILFHQKYT